MNVFKPELCVDRKTKVNHYDATTVKLFAKQYGLNPKLKKPELCKKITEMQKAQKIQNNKKAVANNRRVPNVAPPAAANNRRVPNVAPPAVANNRRVRNAAPPAVANNRRVRNVAPPAAANNRRVPNVAPPAAANNRRVPNVAPPAAANNRRVPNAAQSIDKNSFNPDLCGSTTRGRQTYNVKTLKMFAKAYSISDKFTKLELCKRLKEKFANNGAKSIKNIKKRVTQFEDFALLLKKDGRFSFVINMFSKLVKNREIIEKFIKTYKNRTGFHPPPRLIQNKIFKFVGPCHLQHQVQQIHDPVLQNKKKADYLQEMDTQLHIGIDLFYSKLNNHTNKPAFIAETLDKFETNLGGRPCLENAIGSLIDSMTELAFNWKGKNQIVIWNTGKTNYKNRVIGSAVGSYAQSLNGNNKDAFSLLSKSNKSKQMWNKFKYLQLYMTKTKYNQPWYYNVRQLPNGKRVTMEAIEEYLNYLD